MAAIPAKGVILGDKHLIGFHCGSSPDSRASTYLMERSLDTERLASYLMDNAAKPLGFRPDHSTARGDFACIEGHSATVENARPMAMP